MLYLVAFGIFIYILIKTLKFDDVIKNMGKPSKQPIVESVKLLYKPNDSKMANYLDINYKNNKLKDEIPLKINKVENDINIVDYVNTNTNTIGIINELELEQNLKQKNNLRFMCAPQKFVLFFLLQYYQKDDYISKVKAILDPENMDSSLPVDSNVDTNAINKEKTEIRNKLDRIYRLNLQNIQTYIKEDQEARLKENDTKPYIIAVDSEDSLTQLLFKNIAGEMGWKSEEYTGQPLTKLNTNTIFYKLMTFDDAISQFIKTSDSVDSLFYLRDERDWKVKELFVNYYINNKKAPIIIEIERKENTKSKLLNKTFIHMIDTSLYYTNKSVGGNENTEDESLQIRLPTLAIRNVLFCNINTDSDIVLLLTAICIQNLKYLQQYMFAGCKDGENQFVLAKKMNELEANIAKTSLQLIKENANTNSYETGENLNKLIDQLEEAEMNYINISRQCQDRIPMNPFPNLDEIVFCFPSQKVHPVSKEYFHDNGLYTRNSKYEYDLNYYAKKVKEYYYQLNNS